MSSIVKPPKKENNHNVVLITGAGRRIGREIALDLARFDWDVVVHYNGSKADADDLIQTITSFGGQAAAVQANLLREKETVALMERASKIFGPITCLINNASIFEEDTATTQGRDIWDRHMEVNFRAPFLLSQELAAQMPSGERGNIINILDQKVWNLTPEFTSYTLSKAGLWNATKVLARAFAPNIRVNAIGPGPTLQSIHQSKVDFQTEWGNVPLGQPVLVGDICKAINFIIETSAVTGQMIAIDSGQHMG